MKFSILILLLSFRVSAAVAGFQVDHRIALTGGEGWDCLIVEPVSERLYVTRGDHVDVVDLKTEKLVGTVSGSIDGAHGVALVPELGKGYVTSGKTDKVVVFDLKTLKIQKEISAGKKPDIILYNAATSRILSFNGADSSVTWIDTKTDEAVKTTKLSGKPEFAVENGSSVYVNDEDKSQVNVLDAKEMSVTKTWPYKKCKSPSGLAADWTQKKLFAACDNETMEVLDSETGNFIQTIPIGKSPDGAALDAGLIFSSNGGGSLTIAQLVKTNHYSVLQELPTQKGARTMAVNPNNHDVYLVAAKYEDADPAHPTARPKIKAGSVEILVVRRH